MKVVGCPVRLTRTPPSVRTAPPLLGQDTDDILGAGFERGPDPVAAPERGGPVTAAAEQDLDLPLTDAASRVAVLGGGHR